MPIKTSVKKLSKVSKSNLIEKVEAEIESNQSKVSMVLGALIILVVGILVFNYFNRSKSDLGPAQQTSNNEQQDVAADQLPGKYTVKEGDTLFNIAEAYYKNGENFTEIAKANNITDVNRIETGQVLELPKLAITQETLGTGGGNSTIWGDRIEGNTYTVLEGDWLSTIAGRAYGDIMAFDKIAKANNISDPNNIEPGTVLTIPR